MTATERRLRDVFRRTAAVCAVLVACACGMPAHAQSCVAFQPVQNTTFAHANGTPGTVANWTLNGWGGISPGTTGVWHVSDAIAAHSLEQTIFGVAPSSQVLFRLTWGNGSGAQGSNGNRAQLDVIYGGVVYARFQTSALQPGAPGAPGPSTGANYAALNGASIAPTPPATWTVGSAQDFTLTLPAAVASSGLLQFQTTRLQSATSDGATDDFYLDSASAVTTTLCLRKTTTTGTGTFSFPTTTNLDTDIVTAGVQSGASIATAVAGTPVPFDAGTGAGNPYPAGNIEPALMTQPGAGVTLQETPPAGSGYAVTAAVCDNGVSATVGAGNTVTTGAIPLRAQVTCTVTNGLSSDLRISKTNTPLSGPSDQAGDTVTTATATTYSLRVVNAGPAAAVNAIVRDTPGAGITCPGALGSATITCSATSSPAGATTCPGAGVLTAANLFGGGIAIPNLAASPTPATPNNFVTLTATCTVN
jgi:hypothetical protein